MSDKTVSSQSQFNKLYSKTIKLFKMETNNDKKTDDANVKSGSLNADAKDAVKNISDIEIFGNGDQWRLLCKASSKEQGWMKSTKAMDVGVGVIVQVTTQQKNADGSYTIAEALTFVPAGKIHADEKGGTIG
jgi:hypothetical protein